MFVSGKMIEREEYTLFTVSFGVPYIHVHFVYCDDLQSTNNKFFFMLTFPSFEYKEFGVFIAYIKKCNVI